MRLGKKAIPLLPALLIVFLLGWVLLVKSPAPADGETKATSHGSGNTGGSSVNPSGGSYGGNESGSSTRHKKKVASPAGDGIQKPADEVEVDDETASETAEENPEASSSEPVDETASSPAGTEVIEPARPLTVLYDCPKCGFATNQDGMCPKCHIQLRSSTAK